MSNYSEIVTQIEELKKQAEKIRKEEFSSVVKAIKKQMADYGITPEDLGLKAHAVAKLGRKSRAVSKNRGSTLRTKRTNSGVKVVPKYADDAGNTWTGRGKQPKWIVSAIASGRSLESMKIR